MWIPQGLVKSYEARNQQNLHVYLCATRATEPSPSLRNLDLVVLSDVVVEVQTRGQDLKCPSYGGMFAYEAIMYSDGAWSYVCRVHFDGCSLVATLSFVVLLKCMSRTRKSCTEIKKRRTRRPRRTLTIQQLVAKSAP